MAHKGDVGLKGLRHSSDQRGLEGGQAVGILTKGPVPERYRARRRRSHDLLDCEEVIDIPPW